jgi:hypothetical protein
MFICAPLGTNKWKKLSEAKVREGLAPYIGSFTTDQAIAFIKRISVSIKDRSLDGYIDGHFSTFVFVTQEEFERLTK